MSSITTSNSLIERLGIALVVAGALLLSTRATPALASYLCLTIGSVALVAALRKSNPPQAFLQLIFLMINTLGLTVELARHA